MDKYYIVSYGDCPDISVYKTKSKRGNITIKPSNDLGGTLWTDKGLDSEYKLGEVIGDLYGKVEISLNGTLILADHTELEGLYLLLEEYFKDEKLKALRVKT